MPLFWLQGGEVTPYAPSEASEPEPAPAALALPSGLARAWASFAEPVDRQRVVTVEQVMTRSVVSLGPEATLAEARRLMERHGVRHVPVVEGSGALVGMVEDRDLLRAEAGGVADDLPLARAMNTHVLTASPDTDLVECAQMMLSWRIACLPVLDGPMRRVLGVLTHGDLLRAVVSDAPIDVWL